MDRPPDYLVIGHITKDIVTDGLFTIGGTVTYAATTACNLGQRTAIVTRADSSLNLSHLEERGICILRLSSSETTTFQNIYLDGTRLQYIRAVAPNITSNDVPPAWRRARIVHLGPLTQELPSSIVRCFPGALVGVTPQGWMRHWGADGLVHPTAWEGVDEVMATAHVLVYSIQDVAGDEGLIRHYGSLARIMVVTQGARGATVYCKGQRPRHFPAFVTVEVDPTGAGDVFCAAYLVVDLGSPGILHSFPGCRNTASRFTGHGYFSDK